jgi:hypothetical protein
MTTSRCLILSLLTLAMAGCAAEESSPTRTDKNDLGELPAVSTNIGKADNPWYPTDGGSMLVGEQIVADFDSELGWIGYEAELTGGTVDIDVAEYNKGSDAKLDTILIVYGPQRDNGSYPRRAAAFNDDVADDNLNSHIVFDVEEAGTYRIVTSTYLNWAYYPYNVSEGSYALTMKCQDGPDACGPAL